MGTFVKKQKPDKQRNPADVTPQRRPSSTQNQAAHSILTLQRTIGNQAVLRMLKRVGDTPNPLCCNTSKSCAEHDSCRTPMHHAAETVQTKIMMSIPGDKYEEEADAVAEQVVQQSTNDSPPSHIQQSCTTCDSLIPLQNEITEEENKPVQRTAATGGSDACNASASVYTQIEQSRCSGQALDPTIREKMNDAFQADFSSVRIHTGQQAVKMNQQLNARAFTHENHIYFNEHQYQPETLEGKRLLAHELTHVIQQRAAHSILQKTGQGSPPSAGAYTVEQAAELLNLSFSMVPRALEDTEISESQKQKIRILYARLRRVYGQIEDAGRTGNSTITPTFDTTPEANEINTGDANKSVTELYYPFSVAAPPPAQQPPLELQAKLKNNKTTRVTQIPSGQNLVQRVACGGICIGIIVLGGLLLSGCNRSSSGPMGATRLRQAEQNFDRNNSQLNATERSKIHTALNGAVGNNTNLLVSYYDYYSNQEIVKASAQQAQAWIRSGLYAQTDPLGDTTVSPRILEASFPDNRLGALLIHEYVHTKHHSNPMGFYDYEEGEAYGVEYYLAERNGDQQRMTAIQGIMSNLSSIAMTSVHGALRQRFCKCYGAMKGLYQVIDTGSSTFQGSPFSTLTQAEARALSAELISVRSDNFSTVLNNILTWVYANRTVIGIPILRCS